MRLRQQSVGCCVIGAAVVIGVMAWISTYHKRRVQELAQIDSVVARIATWGGRVTRKEVANGSRGGRVVQFVWERVFGEPSESPPVAVDLCLSYVDSSPRLRDEMAAGVIDVVPEIVRLRSIRSLRIRDITLNEESLVQLGKLEHLEVLVLENCHVDGEWLGFLRNLKSLKRLSLEGNQISDEHLRYVQHLSRLEVLVLDDTAVTGDDPEWGGWFAQVEKLKLISFSQSFWNGREAGSHFDVSQLDGLGVMELKAVLPYCEVSMGLGSYSSVVDLDPDSP